jgi:hypothetical protein
MDQRVVELSDLPYDDETPEHYRIRRTRATGRDLAAHFAHRHTTATLRELTEPFALTHPDSVSNVIHRAGRSLTRSAKQRKELTEIQERISKP